MKKKVSIIIPVYNSSYQLRKTIESIYKQDYPNFEIILVNDGSTKHSSINLYETIVHDFPKTKIINNKNQGVVRSRIDGVKNADGEYIMFSDHDDVYLTNSIFKLVNAANKSNADIIIANAYSKRISWLPLNVRRLGIYSHKIIEREDFFKKEYLNFFGYNHFAVETWGKLYKTSIMKAIDWDIYDFNFFDDIILNIQIFYQAKKIQFLPDIIYCHNYGGISSVFDIKTIFKGYTEVYHLKSKYLAISNNLENKKYVFYELRNILYSSVYRVFETRGFDKSVLRKELSNFRMSIAFKDLYVFYDQKDILINFLYDENYDSIFEIGEKYYKDNYFRIKIRMLVKKTVEKLL